MKRKLHPPRPLSTNLLPALIVMVLCSLIPSPAQAQSTQTRLNIIRNDGVAGGVLQVRVEIKQTGISSATLAGFTADLDYDDSQLTNPTPVSTSLASQGYALTFSPLNQPPASGTGSGPFVRMGAVGNAVGTDLGDQAGVDVAGAYGQDFGTIQFTLTAAGAAAGTPTLFIRSGSKASSYFDNAANNPEGGVTNRAVSIEDNASAPLPVELVAFEAVRDGGAVVLSWQTASETNNAGFFVERGVERAEQGAEREARAWEQIAFVEGRGTTTEAQVYTYRVEDLTVGQHVFRLKQVDFDGAFEHSPEVEVTVEMAERFALSPAYPNPFNPQTTFTLAVREAQEVAVEVYNMLGQRVAVLHQGALAANETHRFVFEAGRLGSGLYLIRAKGETFATTRQVTLVK